MVAIRWLPSSDYMLIIFVLIMAKTESANGAGTGTTDDLEIMFQKMEKDVISFAREMESLLLPQNKCTTTVLESCGRSNYDGCVSVLPYPQCPGGSEFASTKCGDGTKCGATYDFSTSTLRLAPGSYSVGDFEPNSMSVKDAVCYSKQAEQYMTYFTNLYKSFWARYSVSPPAMFYGADNGVFRIYPGNPKDCPTNYNTYDPRRRPWYVAASTGPKDVVLVLDTSGSMGQNNRINLMKDAAKYVIETLSVSDYVSVVTFNTNAQSLTSSKLQRGNAAQMKSLISQIDNLSAGGNTNFYAGFQVAFDTIRQSVDTYELTAGCQRAILFLTDGEITAGLSGNDLMSYIKTQLNYYTSTGKPTPVIFTYSFGTDADEVMPKRIACETNGIWASIYDGGDLAKSMTAYYKYFAFGLSDSRNSNFAAWVEPYEFASGQGLGTSVSTPVFDRSVNPPILAGVVALDISIAALQNALGEQGESGLDKTIQRLIDRSVATCPTLNLTQCQYQSLRYNDQMSPPTGALCDGQCTNTTKLSVEVCEGNTYPQTVLNNMNLFQKTYEERACCHVGAQVVTMGSSDVCKDTDNKNNVIAIAVGASVGGFAFIVAVILIACLCSKKRMTPPKKPEEPVPVVEPDIVVASLVENGKIDAVRVPNNI